MAPRLPTAEELGGPGSYNSGRGIASYDVSPMARGAKELGQGAQNLGNAMLGVGLQKLREEDKLSDGLEEAQARADLLTASAKRRSEISDAIDGAELQKTQEAGARADLEAAASRIQDPNRRALFMESYRPQVTQLGITAKDKAFALDTDAKKATVLEQLNKLRDTAVADQDESKRTAYIHTGQDLISGLEKGGYITADQAVRQRQDWARSYAVSSLQALSPQQRVEALTPIQTGERSKTAYGFFVSKGWSPAAAAGIVGGLIHESVGLNTSALNPRDGADGSDSIGLAQWNSGRAQQLKAFAADQGKDWRDFGVQLAFVDHELRTTEKAAGDELGRATSARAAAEAFVRYERPRNYEKGATAAHGWGNRLRQAEGVLATYGGGKLPTIPGSEVASLMSPDDRRTLLRQAESEVEGLERRAQRARHDEAAALQARMGDDFASIERTGQGNPGLTSADVERTMGPQAVEAWQGQRARSLRVYEALDGIEGLPEGEVERRLQSLEPKPGGDGYTDDMAAYTKARTKADKFLQARRADPALAVEALPAVKEARAAAQYQGEGDKRQIAPESAQAIVRARLATQNQLGIPEPLAVTRSEASVIGRQLRYIGDDDAAGLRRFVQQLQGTYGEYADEVLAATIQHQNINRDLAVSATEVLTKIGRGQVPNPFDQRRLERAHDAQRLDDALAGRGGQPSAVGQSQATQAPGGAGRKASGASEPAEFQGAATGKDLQALHANRTDPTVLAEFDATYGPGTAKRALAEIDRRLGSQERR